MKSLALFDFDGTLTTRDTLLEFLKFYVGPMRFYLGMILLLPILVGYKLKLIKNWVAKEWVITYFLKGEDINTFLAKGKSFSLEVIPELLRKEAMDRLEWHRTKQHRIVVVSASAAAWIAPWAEMEEIELVSTFLQLKEGRLTGKINGKNCFGLEKRVRILEIIDPDEYEHIYAYGDSKGDKEMLEMATDPFYRRFS